MDSRCPGGGRSGPLAKGVARCKAQTGVNVKQRFVPQSDGIGSSVARMVNRAFTMRHDDADGLAAGIRNARFGGGRAGADPGPDLGPGDGGNPARGYVQPRNTRRRRTQASPATTGPIRDGRIRIGISYRASSRTVP